MPWTSPTTWTAGQLVTALDLNQQIRDNLGILKTSISNDGTTWQGVVTAGNSSAIGWSDGYFTRVAANSVKFWNGTTLGTFQAGTVSDSVGSMATLRASIPTAPVLDMAGGRLTLESGVAVSTSDQSAKTTLYYTPHIHNVVSLYSGSVWETVAFSELSITLAGLTASKPYDVFAYNNAGTATLELLVWTSATARATALVKQDGRWCKTGALTRRYLGTIYINSTGGQTDDSLAFRYVWNANNRVIRPMRVLESTASWTYNSAAWHQANASATNELNFVIGLPDVCATAQVTHTGNITSAAAAGMAVGIGLDSTSALATGATSAKAHVLSANTTANMVSSYAGYPGIGKHRLVWLEYGDGSTTTWYGASGFINSGIVGSLEG